MKTSYPRITRSYVKMLNPSLVAFTRNIVSSMTNNPQYPAPSPSLAIVSAAADALEMYTMEAFDGGKIAIASRKAARANLISLLKQLAAYVQGHCGQSFLNAISSGFETVKPATSIGILPAPENPRLLRTNKSGQLLFRFSRMANAKNYSIQISTAPDGTWIDKGLSSKAKVLFDGLTPGLIYWGRSRANGSAGSGPWSQPACAMTI